jgi:hypothetical protein
MRQPSSPAIELNRGGWPLVRVEPVLPPLSSGLLLPWRFLGAKQERDQKEGIGSQHKVRSTCHDSQQLDVLPPLKPQDDCQQEDEHSKRRNNSGRRFHRLLLPSVPTEYAALMLHTRLFNPLRKNECLSIVDDGTGAGTAARGRFD